MIPEEIVKLFGNLAAFANTPAGQEFLIRLAEKNFPTPAELHDSISKLPDAASPPSEEKHGG